MDQILINKFIDSHGLKAARSKALTLSRLLAVKNRFGLNQGEVAKHVFCVALACEQLLLDYDSKLFIKQSGLKEDVYLDYFARVKTLLGIKLEYSIETLCNVIKMPSLIGLATKYFKAYKERRIQSLSEKLRASAKFDLPVYNIVSIMFAAKKRTMKVDETILCSKTNTSLTLYKETYENFFKTCFPKEFAQRQEKQEQTKQTNSEKKEKKRVMQEKIDPAKKQKFDEDYDRFKKQLIKDKDKRNAEVRQKAANATKQSTLENFKNKK